ncbi:MAG: M20/M25/M40 family metallo-hydrolase, partial [Bacteroidetes bacterium]
RVQATFEAERSELANVAGMIPGKRKEEIVVFSAHYDHLGIGRPIAGDSIYNGANDDASGTTAVISLAAFFKQQPQPERSLVFVAFTAEEMGGYGSRYFSQQFDPEHITAMFNIEMIGIEAEKGPASAYITGFDRSSLGNIMQQAVQGSMYNFHPDPYPEQNLFYRSDNATLARLGVPAHTIATTPMKPNQPHYHKPSDEFSTVNTQHITHIIRAIALGAMPVVSGEQTPSRVDKSQVN